MTPAAGREPETGPERLARLIRRQASACDDLGSPLYGGLLRHLAADVLAGGPAAAVLAGHEDDPGDDAVALRLMGGAHRLVLERKAPELATFYPSVGGSADAGPDAAWPVLRSVLEEHRDTLRAGLHQPPQTNEVGRAAALIGGLLHVVTRWPRPVRLFEIGASAGLNLRADHFRIDLPDGGGVGPDVSPVVLQDPWRGPRPPLRSRVDVVERTGCDTSPLDPTTTEGRLLLTSYVWPDQVERLARLRGALELAAQVPAKVQQMSAEELVRRVELVPGTTTVIWHSVVWQYIPAAEQASVTARLAELAATASETSPLARLSLEPGERTPGGEHAFFVRLQSWPGGEERILAVAHPHGIPTTWE